MNLLKFSVLCSVILGFISIAVNSESILCYNCDDDNCDELNDDKLIECGPESSATVTTTKQTLGPSSTESEISTTEFYSTTEEPSTSSVSETEESSTVTASPSTSISGTSTTVLHTTTEGSSSFSETSTTELGSTTEESSSSVDSSSSPFTETSTTDIDTTTEEPPSSTASTLTTETELSSEPSSSSSMPETSTTEGSTSSTASSPSTTELDSTSEGFTSPSVSEISTTVSTAESLTSTIHSTSTKFEKLNLVPLEKRSSKEELKDFVNYRTRRGLPKSQNLLSVNLDDFKEETQRAVSKLLRNYRSIDNVQSYHCYKATYTNQSGKEAIKRGCLAVPEELSACDMLQNLNDNKIEKCKICSFDKCNNTNTIRISWFLLLFTIICLKIIQIS